jgi:hypothetical protein
VRKHQLSPRSIPAPRRILAAGLDERRGISLGERALGRVSSRWFVCQRACRRDHSGTARRKISSLRHFELDTGTLADIAPIRRFPNPAD